MQKLLLFEYKKDLNINRKTQDAKSKLSAKTETPNSKNEPQDKTKKSQSIPQRIQAITMKALRALEAGMSAYEFISNAIDESLKATFKKIPKIPKIEFKKILKVIIKSEKKFNKVLSS